jgi:hypothetical protein
MRFWRKTIVLAFAAYGAYRAWELVSSKLDMSRDGAPMAGGAPSTLTVPTSGPASGLFSRS